MKLLDGGRTIKLFRRFWSISYKWIWGGHHYISFYTFKANPPEFDEWESFWALTYTNDSISTVNGKAGWQIER